MIASYRALNLIKKYEGLRLTAYKCPAGVWTIGYGHTKGVTQGMSIITSQAEDFLLQDIAPCEKAVASYDDIYKWRQQEFDALVSFTFNCGAGNLKKLLNNGKRNRSQISQAMLKYCKAGGKTLPGLQKRRCEEKALFDKESPHFTETYYPKYNGLSLKVDDVLKDIGAGQYAHNWKTRCPIAKANGIKDYKGTAEQNNFIVYLAKEGKLKRP